MLDPVRLVEVMEAAQFGPFIGVPCSYLGGVITAAECSVTARYLVANNEGEAVAIAVGHRLTGAKPVVIMQNSGLGNAVNPITSLAQTLRVPVLLLVTWRGQPDRRDEPQHELMGRITRPMLDSMGVRNELMPTSLSAFAALLDEADAHMASTRSPFAVVVPRGSVAAYSGMVGKPAEATGQLLSRAEAIDLLMSWVPDGTALIATTGKTARELEAGHDRPGNLYVVGSMGCASSIALGVALGGLDRPVLVIDGDGAALMRLEALATIGRLAPPNLCHILLDNAEYESTGGQPTGSPGIDFTAVAVACGYHSAVSVESPAEVTIALAEAASTSGPTLVHVPIRSGSDPHLGRPELSPPASAARFERYVSA